MPYFHVDGLAGTLAYVLINSVLKPPAKVRSRSLLEVEVDRLLQEADHLRQAFKHLQQILLVQQLHQDLLHVPGLHSPNHPSHPTIPHRPRRSESGLSSWTSRDAPGWQRNLMYSFMMGAVLGRLRLTRVCQAL